MRYQQAEQLSDHSFLPGVQTLGTRSDSRAQLLLFSFNFQNWPKFSNQRNRVKIIYTLEFIPNRLYIMTLLAPPDSCLHFSSQTILWSKTFLVEFNNRPIAKETEAPESCVCIISPVCWLMASTKINEQPKGNTNLLVWEPKYAKA